MFMWEEVIRQARGPERYTRHKDRNNYEESYENI